MRLCEEPNDFRFAYPDELGIREKIEAVAKRVYRAGEVAFTGGAEKELRQLEALGFPVFCVDRLEQIQPAVDALLCWTPGEPIPQGIGAKIPEMPEVNLPEKGGGV